MVFTTHRKLGFNQYQIPEIQSRKRFPSCQAMGTALLATSRTAWQQRAVPRHGNTCQPLWHPLDTLRARCGGDSAVATWDRAGLPGQRWQCRLSARILFAQEEEQVQTGPRGTPDRNAPWQSQHPGAQCGWGSPQLPGSPGWAVLTQMPPFARMALNPGPSTQCAGTGEPRPLGVQGGCGKPRLETGGPQRHGTPGSPLPRE